jgi:hypothetical protein
LEPRGRLGDPLINDANSPEGELPDLGNRPGYVDPDLSKPVVTPTGEAHLSPRRGLIQQE